MGYGNRYKKIFEISKNDIEKDNRGSGGRKYQLEWRNNEEFICIIIDEIYIVKYPIQK